MDVIKAQNIITICQQNGMPLQLSKFIACQSCFETNNWTSNAFLQDNNGFGYKHVIGAHLQLPEGGIHSTETDRYAAYPSFENSIIEICQWILRRQKQGSFPRDLTIIQMPESYALLLKNCGYYGALESDYAKGLAMYFEELNASPLLS